MPQLDREMFKKFMTAVVLFIIFISILLACYDLVSESVVNAFTGNITWDSLLYIVPIVFSGAVIFILYKNYIPKGD
jgi:hypothetical protein